MTEPTAHRARAEPSGAPAGGTPAGTWWAPGSLTWWIASLFALGSVCFLVAPFPGFVQHFGSGVDGMVYFVGSIFFTAAADAAVRRDVQQRSRAAGRRPAAVSARRVPAPAPGVVGERRAARRDGVLQHQHVPGDDDGVRQPGVRPARLDTGHPRLHLLPDRELPGLRRRRRAASPAGRGIGRSTGRSARRTSSDRSRSGSRPSPRSSCRPRAASSTSRPRTCSSASARWAS